MPYRVIANADAGSSDDLDEAVEVLAATDSCSISWTETKEDLDAVLRDIDGDIPVVAGGDGTFHLFANRYARLGLDLVVGLLPLGTGNDLARGLDIPLDPAGAADRILSGKARRLPLIEAPDGELCINNAHIGVGVDAARRGEDWKSAVGPLAYLAGSVVEGLTHSGVDVTVAVDGSELFSGRAISVMVLNGPSAGGGYEPLEGLAVSRPDFDVLVVESGGDVSSRLKLAYTAATQGLDHDAHVETRRGRSASISFPGGTEWEIDGEFRTWDSPAAFSLSEMGWTVIA